MDKDLTYKMIKPGKQLSAFVDSFWYLHNQSDRNKETTGLPDGRIDLFLFQSDATPFRIVLIGAGTQYNQATIPAHSRIYCVSFKLPAIEYVLHETISDIVNKGKILPEGFWGFTEGDIQDFDLFVEKATHKIQSLLPEQMDERKRRLFELLYAANGAITVKELAEKSFWSSRQINRYFHQQFGISLKAYVNVLRFRASLEHIAKGRLFPEENFYDQNHFIKEIKKIAGVVPKELSRNENDRFILLSSIRSA